MRSVFSGDIQIESRCTMEKSIIYSKLAKTIHYIAQNPGKSGKRLLIWFLFKHSLVKHSFIFANI